MMGVSVAVCFLVFLCSCTLCHWISLDSIQREAEKEGISGIVSSTSGEYDDFGSDLSTNIKSPSSLEALTYTDEFNNSPLIDSKTVTIQGLVKVVNILTSKLKNLEKTNKKLLDKVDLLEKHVKTNDLIFFNVHGNKNESYESTMLSVLYVINQVMKVDVNADNISMAVRAGSSLVYDRPIVVRFTTFATKMRVLGARSKLNSTDMVVTGDYSEDVTKTRSELLYYMFRARAAGHSAFLLYDKLVVNGKPKTLQELQLTDNEDDHRQYSEEEKNTEQCLTDCPQLEFKDKENVLGDDT